MDNDPQLPFPHHTSPAEEEALPASRVLIDVAALAELLGVTQRFVRRLIAEDRVPFLKIGKFVRFDPREIDQWINDTRHPSIASARGS